MSLLVYNACSSCVTLSRDRTELCKKQKKNQNIFTNEITELKKKLLPVSRCVCEVNYGFYSLKDNSVNQNFWQYFHLG